MSRPRIRLSAYLETSPGVPAANDVEGAVRALGSEGPADGRQAAGRPSNRERAQTLFHQRRDRARSFGDHARLFQEAPWDILLELYLCHEDGRVPSTTGVAYGAGVPITIALRYFKKLEQSGLVDSWMDPHDTRVRRLRMTRPAVNMMLRYLDGI